MVFKSMFEQDFSNIYIPRNGLLSLAQPFSMCYKNVYAAISNLSLESGIMVSGLLSCDCFAGIRCSINYWRDWFTMPDAEIVFDRESRT